MTGLSIFIIGSMMGAMSTTLGMIIFSRAIQGAASGLMMPIAMTLIFNAFQRSERGLSMGIYGIAALFEPAIGRIEGGVVFGFIILSVLFHFNFSFDFKCLF